jgi:hypothetical protein
LAINDNSFADFAPQDEHRPDVERRIVLSDESPALRSSSTTDRHAVPSQPVDAASVAFTTNRMSFSLFGENSHSSDRLTSSPGNNGIAYMHRSFFLVCLHDREPESRAGKHPMHLGNRVARVLKGRKYVGAGSSRN